MKYLFFFFPVGIVIKNGLKEHMASLAFCQDIFSVLL